MSCEIKPVGMKCPLKCTYCYQTVQREHQEEQFDKNAVFELIPKLQQSFSLFGGEALLTPLPILEDLLKAACDKWGHSGVQTNAVLLTEEHIQLFIKYKTHVGISIDGPGELNDSRWAGSLERTRECTRITENAIKMLCERAKTHPSLIPSLIVTLHNLNASQEHWNTELEWFHKLETLGVRTASLHVMEKDYLAASIFLNEDELGDRLIDLWKRKLTGEFTTLDFGQFFSDILGALQGSGRVMCTWKPCDPWNTQAVYGIEADGSLSHCSRTNKDEYNWLPAEGGGIPDAQQIALGHPGRHSYVRQLALYSAPQEHGGCQDCKYWLSCYGQCPGTAIGGDWRMRSSYCDLWVRLLDFGANLLRASRIVPLCDKPDRVELAEQLFQLWAKDTTATIDGLLQKKDTKKPTCNTKNNNEVWHYDGPNTHGDSDAHGDHYDK